MSTSLSPFRRITFSEIFEDHPDCPTNCAEIWTEHRTPGTQGLRDRLRQALPALAEDLEVVLDHDGRLLVTLRLPDGLGAADWYGPMADIVWAGHPRTEEVANVLADNLELEVYCHSWQRPRIQSGPTQHVPDPHRTDATSLRLRDWERVWCREQLFVDMLCDELGEGTRAQRIADGLARDWNGTVGELLTTARLLAAEEPTL